MKTIELIKSIPSAIREDIQRFADKRKRKRIYKAMQASGSNLGHVAHKFNGNMIATGNHQCVKGGSDANKTTD